MFFYYSTFKLGNKLFYVLREFHRKTQLILDYLTPREFDFFKVRQTFRNFSIRVLDSSKIHVRLLTINLHRVFILNWLLFPKSLHIFQNSDQFPKEAHKFLQHFNFFATIEKCEVICEALPQ